MPELPEVEVLVRYLHPALRGRTIRRLLIHRPRIIRSTTPDQLTRALTGARFRSVTRRGKYILFELESEKRTSRGTAHPRVRPKAASILVVGHLGMTGRMYVRPSRLKVKPAGNRPPSRQPAPVSASEVELPRHTAISLELDRGLFIFEDVRYFGRFSLAEHTDALASLGPEPLGPQFTPAAFHRALAVSRQAIKVKLLDQSLVAGIGNIYASEALFRARISPRLPARALTCAQAGALHRAIRHVLTQAIRCGSTIPLDFAGTRRQASTDHRPSSPSASGRSRSNGPQTPIHNRLFYYGTSASRRSPSGSGFYEERLLVYDRAGHPCPVCQTPIKRLVQASRSTYFCPSCQKTAW